MFVVLGTRVVTETLDDPDMRRLPCRPCGVERTHVERRVTRSATVFWVPMANVHEAHVWECRVCGSQVTRPETARWLGAQEGTALGRFQTIVEEGGRQLEHATDGLVRSARDLASTAWEQARDLADSPARQDPMPPRQPAEPPTPPARPEKEGRPEAEVEEEPPRRRGRYL
ncbi:MAG: hypothetical protein KC656_24470 [Myxococcales bacterium]|nr:hypothetical protein [Myxococcales bacterium]